MKGNYNNIHGPIGFINRVAPKLRREVALRLFRDEAFFSPKNKIVSFTFDDFPVSAIENGARILESYGVLGTFYASFGIAGNEQSHNRMVSTQQDMLYLSKKGHELGCHTYNHINCPINSNRIIKKNCIENQIIANNFDASLSFKTFAYPYGSFDFFSKKLISNLYTTARTVEPGINVGKIDRALLKSVPLYNKYENDNHMNWLDQLEQSGGWLIFCTHDVKTNPSPYGCSVKLFESILETCVDRGFHILPVGEASSLMSN